MSTATFRSVGMSKPLLHSLLMSVMCRSRDYWGKKTSTVGIRGLHTGLDANPLFDQAKPTIGPKTTATPHKEHVYWC